MWSLSDVVDASKSRPNDSKYLMMKKLVLRASAENKLKKITEQDDFHAALAYIEESTSVEEVLGSDDDDEEMDYENI